MADDFQDLEIVDGFLNIFKSILTVSMKEILYDSENVKVFIILCSYKTNSIMVKKHKERKDNNNKK